MTRVRKKWLITGASGLLGHHLVDYLIKQDQNVIALYNSHLIDNSKANYVKFDLTKIETLESLIKTDSFDVVMHAAGLTNVDACESNSVIAHTLHVSVTQALASICKSRGIKFVYISTDHLWDGSKALLDELEPVNPINVYGKTKWLGEVQTLEADSQNLVIRTNFFGNGLPWRQSLSDWIIKSLESGNVINGFTNSYFTPIEINYLCAYIFELIEKSGIGTYNVVGSERISKFLFAKKLAVTKGLFEDNIHPSLLDTTMTAAPRPLDMSLSSAKISNFLNKEMPSVSESIKSCLNLLR